MPVASDVIQAYADLPDPEKEKVNKVVSGLPALPAPPSPYIGPLWILVVLAFVIVLIGGTWLLYDLIQDGKATEVIVPIVTASLGVLAGLLAPSPVANK